MKSLLSFLICSVVLFTTLLVAEETPNPVYITMYYSDDCHFCHEVMDEDLPPLFQTYKNELHVVLVNVGTPFGEDQYETLIERRKIPTSRQGFPSIVLNDHLLVGKVEIGNQLAQLVHQVHVTKLITTPTLFGPKQALPKGQKHVLAIITSTTQLSAYSPGLTDRLRLDPWGHTAALVLLITMIISTLFILIGWIQGNLKPCIRKGWRKWLFVVLLIIGLLSSSYLSYVEIKGTKAVCGPVGDCNVVQQSAYAKILGLPIGVLGVIGYLVIITLFAIYQKRSPTKILWALCAVLLIGVLFSAYLTFLEPFVIGGVCIWCLLSALMITLIFWLTSCHLPHTD